MIAERQGGEVHGAAIDLHAEMGATFEDQFGAIEPVTVGADRWRHALPGDPDRFREAGRPERIHRLQAPGGLGRRRDRGAKRGADADQRLRLHGDRPTESVGVGDVHAESPGKGVQGIGEHPGGWHRRASGARGGTLAPAPGAAY